MNALQRRVLSVLLIVLLVGLAACDKTPVNEMAAPTEEPVAGLANPAAVYCEGLGYRMEVREAAEGTDAACIFPDGTECGQWDFLAGRCGQEHSYCQQQGGVLEAGEGNIGSCVFADGSSCLEMAFFEGKCGPGDHPAQ